MRFRALPVVVGLTLAAAPALTSAPAAAALPDPSGVVCANHTTSVRLSDPGTANQTMAGQLCHYSGDSPTTVQVLVHGATYNRSYWRPSYTSSSYVLEATFAGYATYAVDLLGTGGSSHPPSTQLTLNAEAVALHDTITALRSGAVDGHAYSNVILVGHSAGVVVAWKEIGKYHDVAGLIAMGLLHHTSAGAAGLQTVTATSDPKFASSGLDSGYVTTVAGNRSVFYYGPNSSPSVIAGDEAGKDVASTTMLAEARPLSGSPPPATAPSQQVTVPVLIVVGDHDLFWCGADAVDCTSPSIVASKEAPYYPPSAGLSVLVATNNGHSVNMHNDADMSFVNMVFWCWTVAL